MNSDKPPRGRPRTDEARRHKAQICFDDAGRDVIAEALDQTTALQQDLDPREQIAPSRLLSELAVLAARRPDIVREVSDAHRARVLRQREERARRLASA